MIYNILITFSIFLSITIDLICLIVNFGKDKDFLKRAKTKQYN